MGFWLQGGSGISYNEVDENEAVTVKRQGGRTEIRNRRLSLKTKSVMGVVAHVPRIGNGTAWMRRRGGQVLRETLGVCIEQDGASPFQWLLSSKELEIKPSSESCLE